MSKKTWIAIAISAVVVMVIAVLWGMRSGKPQAIRIGAILPLSGTAAEYGKWVQEGFELGRQEINEQGGINGRKFEVVYEDDQAIPRLAAAAMQKLATVDRVPIVFGSWASSCALAEAPIANETRTPILVEAQSPQIRDAGDYVFRIQPDSRYYLKFLAPYAVKKLGLRRFAILYVNNDYGVDQSKVFKQLLEDLGAQVVMNEGFAQGGQDFRAMLAKVRPLDPDGIFVPAYAEAGLILKQAVELGIKSQFLGSAPIENPDILVTAGKAAEGVIYVHHFDPDSPDPRVKNFQKKFRTKYNHEPEGYAALAYDAAYVIAHVLGLAGTDRESIKKALYGVQNFPGATGPTSFDDHGDVIKPIVIRTIRDGHFVTIARESNN
jgi:branched-chain amino acid transport system substrate-binding protein